MERRPRLLVPVLHPSSFILQDIDTLRLAFDVVARPVPTALQCLAALVDLPQADLLFCWFGSVRFLPLVVFARLLRKPVVVVAGGYDVAADPAIQYGNMRPGFTRFWGRLLFRLATVAVAFSEASRRELEENAGVPREKSRLILLGFDVDRPPAAVSAASKRRSVVTVGFIDSSTIHRKGLLTIAAMSRLLPDVPVIFVGKAHDDALEQLKAAAGPNARFAGFVSAAELDAIYTSAVVYAQPSLHEGFGCSVAEAMLYDCIPVVTDRGSLPEVVGDSGYYAAPGDAVSLATAVRRALESGFPGDESPRARVTRLYPLSLRRAQLTALVKDLLAQSA